MKTEHISTNKHNFERTEVTTTTVSASKVGYLDFNIEGYSTGTDWKVNISDYDENDCASAVFVTEGEMMQHMDAFIQAAVDAYHLKEGKYGNAPCWVVTNGILSRRMDEPEDYQDFGDLEDASMDERDFLPG